MNSMDWLARLFRKLGILAHRERFSNELEEEMAFHRAQVEQAFEAEGMTPEQAHYAAARQFGNTIRMKERSHEAVGFAMESVVQDFRFAMRQLRRNPGFAATAVLVLALGICASVAIFAFVDAALIKPLPYPNPSRLMALFSSIPLGPKYNISYLDYLDWKKQNSVFQSLEAYETWNFMVMTSTGTQLAQGVHVSDGFFRTLGISPALGRDFLAGEAETARPHTALLSYAAWQKRFGGRKDVLGQTVTLNGVPSTIIGVLPKNFYFAPAEPAEFWTLLDPSGPCERRRICHNLFGIARLKTGVTITASDSEMKAIAARLEKLYPETNRNQGAVVIPLTEAITGDIRPVLLTLLCGAALLLMIACVNIANLLLVRTESRRREIAIRGALGASRGRFIRQFMTEGLLLAGSGGVLGILCACGVLRLFPRWIPADMLAGMPYLRGLRMSLHVIIFACAVSLVASVLFALAPMLRLSLREICVGLTDRNRSSTGIAWRYFSAHMVVVELSVAVVLLAGAGLLVKSFYRLLHVEVGFQPQHLAVLSIAAPNANYSKDAQAIALEQEIIRRMDGLPGVQSTGVADFPPVSGYGPFMDFVVKAQPNHGEHDEATRRVISTAYLTTLGARLMRGRCFTESDDASRPPVAIINQTMARRYFPGENAIGKQIAYSGSSTQQPQWIEIVGVIADIKEGALDQENYPAIYMPFRQNPESWFSVVVRNPQAESSLLPALATAMRKIDPSIAVYDETGMSEQIQTSQTAYLHRSSAYLVGGFAVMALLLSIVGLYGVTAYSVSQRTREIGVRMALGAHRGAVYRMVLGEAGWLTAVGIGAGLACSIAAATLMRKLLFGVSAWDATTLAGVVVVLAVAALLASYIPARRAASVNPVDALRAE